MSNDILQAQIAELCDTFELAELAKVKVGKPSDSTVTHSANGIVWTTQDEEKGATKQRFDNLEDFIFTVCETGLRDRVHAKTRDSFANVKSMRHVRMSFMPNDVIWKVARGANSEVAFREARNIRIEKRNISKFIRKHKINSALGLKNPKLIYANAGQRLQKIGAVMSYAPLILGWLAFSFTNMPKSIALSIFAICFLISWWSVILEGGDFFDRWKLGYLKWQKRYYSAFLVLALIIIYGILFALGGYAVVAKWVIYSAVAVAVAHIFYF